jgi:hypothetical protein
MSDTISNFTTNSRGRRTIHRPSKILKSKSRLLDEITIPKKSGLKSSSSNQGRNRRMTISSVGTKDIYYSKEPRWEAFDNLATEISENDVRSIATRVSLASGYTLNAHKMMPDVENMKVKSSKRTTGMGTSNNKYNISPKKDRQFNYKIKDESDEFIVKEVEVIYEEVSSLEQTKEKNKHFNTAKSHLKFDSPRRRKGTRLFDYQAGNANKDEYLVKMDQSFHRDLKQASSKKGQLASTPNKNGIKIQKNEDETLDLSPINRENLEFQERSLEVENDYDDTENAQFEPHIEKPVEIKKL